MSETNVPDQGKAQISQDDSIKDAAGKILPQSQQNSVRDHLVSSELITEDGKPAEDVDGVFRKATSAVSRHGLSLTVESY